MFAKHRTMHDIVWLISGSTYLVRELQMSLRVHGINYQPGRRISTSIFGSLDVMHRESVLSQQELPALNAQAGFGRIDEVLMVGVNNHSETKQHGAVFAQHFNARQKIKFHRHVIHLMLIETSGVAGENLVLLHNDATDLFSAVIGVDAKGLLKVEESK